MAKKTVTTPKGKAIWPHITGSPDFKYDKERGSYRIKVNYPSSDVAAIVEEAQRLANEKLAEAKKEYAGKKLEKGQKKPKLKLTEDVSWIEEEDGTTTLNFKMGARFQDRETKEWVNMRPAVFGPDLKPLDKDKRVGGGSVVRVSFEYNPFFSPGLGAGCGLRLRAVQVIELVEFGADASYYGFEQEEGAGFDNEDDTDEDASDFADDSEDTDNESEDADDSDDAEGDDF